MNIIDLFSGCGGFSKGFELAGFKSLFALEKDTWAAETYQANHPDTQVLCGDITEVHSPLEILDKFNISKGSIHGIIGGPPCQGFSLSGARDPKDPRNSLFMDYLRFVDSIRPKFFVIENVKGILSAKTKHGDKVTDIIRREADSIGYNIDFKILNSAWFGVPQARERVFFIGLRKDLPFDAKILFPKQQLNFTNFVTVEDAIMDLPKLKAGEGDEVMDYDKKPLSDYAKWCRKDSTRIHNHAAMRHTTRLVERFKVIQWGQSVSHVSEEHSQRKRGDASILSGKTYGQNNMRVFPNLPSPTVPASFQSNFIHPYEHRNFTAREGARLQSFPDDYIFKGNRTTMSWEKNLSQYQQIGNAVPPLLAQAIAKNITDYLEHLDSIKEFKPTFNDQLSLFA